MYDESNFILKDFVRAINFFKTKYSDFLSKASTKHEKQEICNKLKAIDLKLDEEDRDNKAGLIYQGIVAKKSDSNITWEK